MNCLWILLLLSCCGQNTFGNGCNCGRGRAASTGGCGCARERQEERRARREERSAEENNSCDIPGMIPPPWKEYTGFSGRTSQDDCGCDA